MVFLWHARPDAENMAIHSAATFWYVLPSLPMFLLVPALIHRAFISGRRSLSEAS